MTKYYHFGHPQSAGCRTINSKLIQTDNRTSSENKRDMEQERSVEKTNKMACEIKKHANHIGHIYVVLKAHSHHLHNIRQCCKWEIQRKNKRLLQLKKRCSHGCPRLIYTDELELRSVKSIRINAYLINCFQKATIFSSFSSPTEVATLHMK